jgi:hypothetical protein
MTPGSFNRPLGHACAGLLLALLGTSLSAQTPAPATQIYTCTDASGRKLNSDRPIRECLDREQTILNPSGTVKAKLGPVMTATERSQSEARLKAEELERAKRDDEKRLSRSLLMRYPNPAAHQKYRDEAVTQLMRVRQAGETRMTELLAEQAKLDEEMAFYAKDPGKAPAKLQREVNALTRTLAEQAAFLSDKDNEINRINSNFEEESKRLEPLWRASLVSGSLASTQ